MLKSLGRVKSGDPERSRDWTRLLSEAPRANDPDWAHQTLQTPFPSAAVLLGLLYTSSRRGIEPLRTLRSYHRPTSCHTARRTTQAVTCTEAVRQSTAFTHRKMPVLEHTPGEKTLELQRSASLFVMLTQTVFHREENETGRCVWSDLLQLFHFGGYSKEQTNKTLWSDKHSPNTEGARDHRQCSRRSLCTAVV